MAAYPPLIHEWQAIAPYYHDGLILGNGASIAVHEGFAYDSLYSAAVDRGYLPEAVSEVFDRFETHDFELVLRRLWHATLVNRALGVPEGQVEAAYLGVREALIRTIRDTHVAYDDATPHLGPIASFMKGFRTVISLNYDLVAYWAAMAGNNVFGNWFKDAFQNHRFDEDWTRYRNPYGAHGATLLFYPHGNLMLGQTRRGNEVKVQAGEERDLLSTIMRHWSAGNSVPLFVCEGTTAQKQSSIRASHYLNIAYTEPLHDLGDTVTIYGWGMGTQDDHVMNALARYQPERVAVSVHARNWDFVQWAQGRLRRITNRIDFFHSRSRGCWNNPA